MDYDDTLDVAIIGGGLAGLYAARRLLTARNLLRVTVFEKDAVLGGRAKEGRFGGLRVVTGAGIARRRKDVRLFRLMQELELPTLPAFTVTHNPGLLPSPCDVKKSFQKIRDAYEVVGSPKPAMTFASFAVAVLGVRAYRNFVLHAGYSDFERDDVSQVLYNYSFEDNFTDWSAVAVSWAALVRALETDILNRRHCRVLRGCVVESIARTDTLRYVLSVRHSGETPAALYAARVVVLATDIAGIRALLPTFPLYRKIHGQAFLRLYAKFAPGSIPIINARVPQGVTMVQGPLQKVLPVDKSAGVYMVAYCDNDNAHVMASVMHNTHKNRRTVAALVEHALQLPEEIEIVDMYGFYFPNGTHYYEPVQDPGKSRLTFLARAQRPLQNVFVVGEAVALHQGWVEGALESVDAIFQYLN